MKPAIPWLTCAIGSLLLLIFFGIHTAYKAGSVLVVINLATFLPGLPIGFSTAASRARDRAWSRGFVLPSIVFFLLLYGIHFIH